MRRWQKGKAGALKMGTYHDLYCLGCCWPYFLLMVVLGWMNVLWMGLFAAIIFAEKGKVNDVGKSSLKQALAIEKVYDNDRIAGLMYYTYKTDNLLNSEIIDLIVSV